MVNIPMKVTGPLDSGRLHSPEFNRSQDARDSSNVRSINRVTGDENGMTFGVSGNTAGMNNSRPATPQAPARQPIPSRPPVQPVTPVRQPASPAARATAGIPMETQPAISTPRPLPNLMNPIQKGQKVSIFANVQPSNLKVCLGWNVTNPACDVDVSAFLLKSDSKVPGDDWFVFYGQTTSPDGSTHFQMEDGADRESITVDIEKIHSGVAKIVFVLTINEAVEKRLNFSMLKDAYIRIMSTATGRELVSYKMTDYYANVTSMMIGEVYLHNGIWKFNAIGNGVARDLAGLCEYYGVQVV